jgi:hypothetical protein
MQETKPAVRNLEVLPTLIDAWKLTNGCKWAIWAPTLATMLISFFGVFAIGIIYAILHVTGGRVIAGTIIMGSAVGIICLYFILGIFAGSIKIVLERARGHEVSAKMGFQYFSRLFPLFFTLFLLSFIMLIPNLMSDAVSISIRYFFSALMYINDRYGQIIEYALVICFLVSAVQAIKSKTSFRAPVIILALLVTYISLFLISESMLIPAGLTYFKTLTASSYFPYLRISPLLIATINTLFSIFVNSFLFLSVAFAVDKTNSPFKALFVSFKTLRPHWSKMVGILIMQYVICFSTWIFLVLGAYYHSFILMGLGAIVVFVMQIWLLPFLFLMLGVVYHKLID